MTLTAPLYLLRHGETAWNLERRMQGSKDSALTARGREQAAAMGRALAAELAREPGPTIFLRSPLGRTRETALIVGRALGLDPAEWRDDPRLAELGYGDVGRLHLGGDRGRPSRRDGRPGAPIPKASARPAARRISTCAGVRRRCWPRSRSRAPAPSW